MDIMAFIAGLFMGANIGFFVAALMSAASEESRGREKTNEF